MPLRAQHVPLSLCLALAACAVHHRSPIEFGQRPVQAREVGIEWIENTYGAVPTVNLWLGSAKLRMSLDSGASRAVIGHGVQWYLQLPGEPRAPFGYVSVEHEHARSMFNAVGERVEASLTTPQWVSTELEGLDQATSFYSVALMEQEANGLAGALPPQRIAPPEGGLELDFPAGRMRVLTREQLNDRIAHSTPLEVACASNLGANIFTVASEVDGIPLQLEVDTGAMQSSVHEAHAAGEAVMKHPHRTQEILVAGGWTPVYDVPGRTVRVAGRAQTLSLHVKPRGGEYACTGDGTLGMDVLRACVLVFSRTRGAIRCAR